MVERVKKFTESFLNNSLNYSQQQPSKDEKEMDPGITIVLAGYQEGQVRRQEGFKNKNSLFVCLFVFLDEKGG
jgi:hypothetical protein